MSNFSPPLQAALLLDSMASARHRSRSLIAGVIEPKNFFVAGASHFAAYHHSPVKLMERQPETGQAMIKEERE